MARLACDVFVDARGHRLFNLDVAVLANRFPLDMPHASGPGLVAVRAFELFPDMHVFGQPGGFGEFLAEITVSPSSFHRPRVAHKGAPAAARAVRGRRGLAERVTAALAGGRVVTVKAARMADIARLLLCDRLVAREREVDLLDDL